MKAHFILYVEDQAESTRFYSEVLGTAPDLNVPGMTEFRLGDDAVLGLMPTAGASRLLGREMEPASGPRAEVYLLVDDPEAYHRRALAAGAEEASPLSTRDWGHVAAYSIDPSGHVLAFARSV